MATEIPVTEQQLAALAKAIQDMYASGELLPSQAVKGCEGINALSQAFGYNVIAVVPQEAKRLFEQTQPRDYNFGSDNNDNNDYDYDEDDEDEDDW